MSSLNGFAPFDVLCLREFRCHPDDLDGELFPPPPKIVQKDVDSLQNQDCLTPAAASHDERSTEIHSEIHSAGSYRVFGNRSFFRAAVVIPSRLLNCVRWHSTSRFCAAVVLGSGSKPWLAISCYMPQPAHGLQLFRECIRDVADLIRSVPKYLGSCRIHFGCDANCKPVFSEGLSSHVGPLATERSTGDRAEELLGLLLEFELAAASTFPASAPSEPRETSGLQTLSSYGEPQQTWTSSWKGDGSVKSQIDFVLCPLACLFESFVLYDLVASDHRPVVCHIYDVITTPVKSRSRSVNGWRPRGPDAVTDSKAELKNVPPDPSIGFLENP